MAQPEMTFRIGSCSASVFVNTVAKKNEQDEQRAYRMVSIQRRYRDGDTWKNSTSFALADLPAAITVMQMAMDHVASQEAATGT